METDQGLSSNSEQERQAIAVVPEPPGRLAKVMRLRILKPADSLTWKQLDKTLKDARYRVFRLANLAISDAYLRFHLHRTGQTTEYAMETIGKLNQRLRRMLAEEKVSPEELDRFSKVGALPDTVAGGLSQYKLRAVTAKSKWSEVLRGKAALPTFRLNMAIPIRCDKEGQQRLEKSESGDVMVDLMLCTKPYPRVVLQTGDVGGGARAVLDRLLANTDQSMTSYRQRVFEVKQDDRSGKWWLYITYDMPAPGVRELDKNIIVGVDLGVSCPLYAAINNGHARMGRRDFAALGARIRSLTTQVMTRRREMLRGGRAHVADETARGGHGRKRRIGSIEKLEGRINSAYTTLNHQLSRAVVEFAKNHGAAAIQMEDLTSLKDALRGTFLGGRWRYHQLQEYVKYKAAEAGIEVRLVNPRYTSRRCSKCSFIHKEFTRAFRDSRGESGMTTRFKCPREECGFEADADYNAARNLATLDIARLIEEKCREQKLDANETALSQTDPKPPIQQQR